MWAWSEGVTLQHKPPEPMSEGEDSDGQSQPKKSRHGDEFKFIAPRFEANLDYRRHTRHQRVSKRHRG